MPYFYDPYGRRRAAQYPQAGPAGRVSAEDVQQLAQAYQQLAAAYEQQSRDLDASRRDSVAQAKTLAEVRQELAVKSEALQRQSADLKQLEAELVWTRAALQQQDQVAQPADTAEQSWRRRYEQLQAEIDALRKRWEQRFETETTAARHAILMDMLPLADHLELALRHAAELTGPHAQEYVQNLEATYQAFMATLRSYGVTPIDALGQPFDPNLHEAAGRVQDGATPSGHVPEVLRTGYVEGDKLLRPARVLVRE
jgi:molecular chaperone GrpE